MSYKTKHRKAEFEKYENAEILNYGNADAEMRSYGIIYRNTELQKCRNVEMQKYKNGKWVKRKEWKKKKEWKE